MSVRALDADQPAHPVRPARRRTPRRVRLTEAEAEAALAANPIFLSVEDQVALLERVELRGNCGVFADLIRRMVWRETAPCVRQALLVGRRSARHTISVLGLLFEWRWIVEPDTAWLASAISAFLPRLSAPAWNRLDWRELALVQRCIEVVAPVWQATTSLAVIERLHQACVAHRHHRRYRGSWTHRWSWTQMNLEHWLRRHPGVPLPGTLVATMLGAPDPEIRAWAFESLLPRVECDGPVGSAE